MQSLKAAHGSRGREQSPRQLQSTTHYAPSVSDPQRQTARPPNAASWLRGCRSSPAGSVADAGRGSGSQTDSGVSTASPGENGASAPGLGGKGAGGRGLLGADPGWGDAPAAARSALEAEGDALVCPKGPREGHGSRAKGPRPGLPNRGSASAIAPGSSSATLEGPLSCFPPSLRTCGV